MPDISPNLALPFIQPAQAQKHVTHNEALQRLDVLVQMVVADHSLTLPPALPEEGACYIAATGSTNAWAGKDGQIAAFLNGSWQFFPPKPGWSAHTLTLGTTLTYDGTDWLAAADQPLRAARLGIATDADDTNRLSVRSAATLLSHAGADHQVKVNKAGPSDTASLLFQSGWSGRAEMGLAGDDDFSIKVSMDGASWTESVRVDAQTGRISGAAVQSGPTDSAPERLLKMGAFGLGTAISLTASDTLDALILSGLYYNPLAGNTAGNNYPISSAGALLVIGRSATNVVQEFTSYGGNATAAAVRKFTRSWGAGGWSPWLELYHSGRILGPVSMSGDVPTGAIIERGSNANGAYIRLADGTQICTKRLLLSAQNLDIPYGPFFRSGNVITGQTVYAAMFSVPPTVSITVHVNSFSVMTAIGGTGDVSNTPAVVYPASIISITDRTVYVNVTAVGRWF